MSPPGDAVVLVPRGNDGVGIVGAFASEARPGTRILPIDPMGKALHLDGLNRVTLAIMAQDDASRAAIAAARRVLDAGGWRETAAGPSFVNYERIGGGE